jgi:hypothetical protein
LRGVPSSTTARAVQRRDAVNELYDRGCDLIAAAAAIRREAGASETAPVVPALLGCIERARRPREGLAPAA